MILIYNIVHPFPVKISPQCQGGNILNFILIPVYLLPHSPLLCAIMKIFLLITSLTDMRLG